MCIRDSTMSISYYCSNEQKQITMHELIIFLTGIVVGAMNSVAGGGMLVGFPIMVALGIPPINANATGSIVVLPGQAASVYGYKKYLHKISRKYLLL